MSFPSRTGKATLFLFACVLSVALGTKKYEPNWASIDSRPLPEWYDEAKIGVFISWGLFAVPGYGSEWFWYYWQGSKSPNYVNFMKKNYRPDFTYGDFAAQLNGAFFNADEWVDVLQNSGARYIVYITKHCEGYTFWPSKTSFNWNSVEVGPKRDIVGELAAALRNKTDIRLGLYHSLYEWFNPLFLKDKANGWKTNEFVKNKALPALYELVEMYKPDLFWSDGDEDAPDTYWNSTEFIAWLYNESPVKDHVVTNDRWGSGIMCHHGGYFTCMDRYNPGVLQKRKWENAMTLDKYSWGYRRNIKMSEMLTMSELITTLAETISCGGNLLVNIAITADGTIPPIYESRLRDLGRWLKVNGEGVYKTKPWTHQNDTLTPNVWYTSSKNSGTKIVYAIVLTWPKSGDLYLKAPATNSATTSVKMLGYQFNLPWSTTQEQGGIHIRLTDVPNYIAMTNPWGWVFALSGLHNA